MYSGWWKIINLSELAILLCEKISHEVNIGS